MNFLSDVFIAIFNIDNILLEELQQQAGVFKRNANELKNKMWWKNIKVCSTDLVCLVVL